LVTALGGVLGYAYAKFYTKTTYSATVTFTMEQKSAGALSGFASSLGLGDVSGIGSSSMFGGDNILALMKSNRIIHQVLLTPTDELNGDHLLNFYLKNHYRNFLVKGKMKLFPKTIDTLLRARNQDSLLLVVTKNIRDEHLISKRADNLTSIINLEVKDINEKWAFLFSKMLVQQTIDLYMEIKIGKLISTESDLIRKRDSIRVLLDGGINTLAVETDLNSHSPLMRYKTKQVKKQIDVDVLKAMFGNIIQNLEMTRFQRSQEEPIIEIIDEPIMPLTKNQFQKKTGTFLGAIAAWFSVSFFLLFRKLFTDLLK
jgi:uncharacterized protein involved in exopolysaccharide biosynthesis